MAGYWVNFTFWLHIPVILNPYPLDTKLYFVKSNRTNSLLKGENFLRQVRSLQKENYSLDHEIVWLTTFPKLDENNVFYLCANIRPVLCYEHTWKSDRLRWMSLFAALHAANPSRVSSGVLSHCLFLSFKNGDLLSFSHKRLPYSKNLYLRCSLFAPIKCFIFFCHFYLQKRIYPILPHEIIFMCTLSTVLNLG